MSSKTIFRGSQTYNAVYGKLVEAAKNRTTVTYPDLAVAAQLPMSGEYMATTLNQVLKEIILENIEKSEPLLACLDVRKGDDIPGNGFFMLVGDIKGQSFKDMEDRYTFWEAESKSTYSHWE